MANKTTSKNNKFWFLLLVFSLLGLVGFTLTSFVPGLANEQLEFKMYLKFTFQANLFGFVLAHFVLANRKSVNVQRFKILTLASLTITGIVFWSLIYPKHGFSGYTHFAFATTVILHGVVPVLAILAFWVESRRKQNDIKLKTFKNIFILIIYPILWLGLAVAMYYLKDYAVYSFLDFKNQSITKSIIYVSSIAGAFITFTCIYSYINNKYVK